MVEGNSTNTHSFFLVPCCWTALNLKKAKPNSYYPQCQSALSRTLLHFRGTTFVETAVCGSIVANPIIYRLVPSPSRFEIKQLKSVAREMWGTHDVLQAQLPGNEVAKAHRQLRSLKIWIDEFPNGSFKISLCIRLETMEIQLEQLVLFESGKVLFSWVNSEGHICI